MLDSYSISPKKKYNSLKKFRNPKYTPSPSAIKFWNTKFKSYEEVTICDYLDHLIPILQEELAIEFNDNQLENLIDYINYDNSFTVSMYDHLFFIDKIWNNSKIQGRILFKKFIPIEHKIEEFIQKRQKIKDEMARLNITDYGDYDRPEFQKPLRLKEFLTPLECTKVPSKRDLVFTLSIYKEKYKFLQ